MEIKTYAPVIIPTLNRHEHFKRCLESLERCSGANNTEVYVALDYPPSKKYKEGWSQIDEYLKIKEKDNFFHNLHVIRREHNYGICNENGNYETLEREIFKHYDRYIFTEDDNEFSPNFLEYINKGLEIYKDNPKVFSISGYNYPIDMTGYNANVYASYHMSAWGVGYWKSKLLRPTKSTLLKIIFRPDHFFRLFFNNPYVILSLPHTVMQQQVYGDTFYEYYCFLNHKVSIFPKISKVRNWGHDGSGQHGEIDQDKDLCYNQPIDTSDSFTYDNIEIKDYKLKALKEYYHKPLNFYLVRIWRHLVNR